MDIMGGSIGDKTVIMTKQSIVFWPRLIVPISISR